MAHEQQPDLLLFGKAIRAVRERLGFNASDLAVAARVDQARLSAVEEGRLDPDFELLLALATGLGIGPSAFFLQAEDLAVESARGEAPRDANAGGDARGA
jgi:transcriptional regulator with XRE-family HTH domain